MFSIYACWLPKCAFVNFFGNSSDEVVGFNQKHIMERNEEFYKLKNNLYLAC